MKKTLLILAAVIIIIAGLVSPKIYSNWKTKKDFQEKVKKEETYRRIQQKTDDANRQFLRELGHGMEEDFDRIRDSITKK